ncbi:MAG: HD domain-containing protein [Desulfovibrio sp.]|jgi:3'-5' exoribonuclease|nr:HD domain-containing protein [Desulfovibrio sp.]
MDKGHFVKDIAPGVPVKGLFLVRNALRGRTKNGHDFLTLSLGDCSGTVDAKVWSPLCNEFPSFPPDSVVLVDGTGDMFNEQLQVKVNALDLLAPKEVEGLDVSLFVTPPCPAPEVMFRELKALVDAECRHPKWRALLDSVFGDEGIRTRLMRRPAAKFVHHAYPGGLLEHTLSVCRTCMRMADGYPELDRQTLLVGALFHDLGKTREFEGTLSFDYSEEGDMMGHATIALEMLAPHFAAVGLEPELELHLKHLILSHHGTLEHGAVCLPKTPEAFALHFADNLDAKLATCREEYAKLKESEHRTAKVQSLGCALHRLVPTPGSRQPQTTGQAATAATAASPAPGAMPTRTATPHPAATAAPTAMPTQAARPAPIVPSPPAATSAPRAMPSPAVPPAPAASPTHAATPSPVATPAPATTPSPAVPQDRAWAPPREALRQPVRERPMQTPPPSFTSTPSSSPRPAPSKAGPTPWWEPNPSR